MSEVDLDKLEQLAKLTYEVPWKAIEVAGEHRVETDTGDEADDWAICDCWRMGRTDSEFIAACDPPTILELIKELRDLKEVA